MSRSSNLHTRRGLYITLEYGCVVIVDFMRIRNGEMQINLSAKPTRSDVLVLADHESLTQLLIFCELFAE